MPETFSPIVWHNDTFPAINENALNRIEVGVDAIDVRAAALERGITAPIVVSYATSVTLNATQGALFRCIASGDLTLDDIVGGTDGQLVVFQVQASGTAITLHFTGSTDTVSIAVGQWWVGQFRFVAASSTWLLDDGSGGGGSSGSDNNLNILAPQTVAYATTVTLNAATGALFRITATGDLTLASPINGTDGQAIVVEVLASGGQRAVTFGGGIVAASGASGATAASGTRWTATLRYNQAASVWLLVEGSGSGARYALRPLTLAQVPLLRGVNWYGMEDGLRGPTLAELQAFKARGYSIVRLPTSWSTTTSQITPILADAVTAGIYLAPEVHNYGRIGGTASITATDGTPIDSSNQSTWFSRCTNELAAFGGYASYVPLDMNEPKQTGSVWEPISAGRVSALRGAGWTGPIGVSAAKVSSAGGINNSDAHPGGWWITDSNSFLEVHHYLQPLSDASLQDEATLDAWVISSSGQSDLKTYRQYVTRAFDWGAMGDSRWTNVPMMIGEFAMPPGCEPELEAFMNKADSRRVAAVQWGAGMWSSSYSWKMTEAQYGVLARHTQVQ